MKERDTKFWKKIFIINLHFVLTISKLSDKPLRDFSYNTGIRPLIIPMKRSGHNSKKSNNKCSCAVSVQYL